ncbi:MAG: hemerythrin domain-containing protein [Paludibacteraceae bacterium]|nr:hemerythrin domain-containing protein [Paludibacteraceae bacterium]
MDVNPQLILMLPRFGMKLGFGEKRIEEICRSEEVPVSLFLMLCNVYTFDDYVPSDEEIRAIQGEWLVRYLKASHDYYINHRLPHIRKHVERIAQAAGEIGAVLMDFFGEYQNEVTNHFEKEETTLFPRISERMDRSVTSKDSHEMTYMHDNIGAKWSDLTNSIIKYLPAEIMPNERIGVWFDLAQLSKDLDKHAIIEEKILIPYFSRKEGGEL